MMRIHLAALAVAVGLPAAAHEPAPKPRPTVDLTGFKTVRELTPADPKVFRSDAAATALPGYLGVEIGADKTGRAVVLDVDDGSPAAAAGLKAGDVMTSVAGTPTPTAAIARDRLRGRTADESLKVAVERGTETKELTATLRVLTKPFTSNAGERAVIGAQLSDADSGPGAKITSVTAAGAADEAGLKVGDVILKINTRPVESYSGFREMMTVRIPGEILQLSVKRGKEEIEVRIPLRAETSGRGGIGTGWDDRLPRAWAKTGYKLAIIGIEYPDVKHNPKIADADWNASMFSRGSYTEKSATGQRVFGSMTDYYKEISYGKLDVTGKFVGWVEVSKKRMEYSTGSGVSSREKTSLLTETLDKYLDKNGPDSLKEYDGVFFLFAGGRVQTTRGSLYWPHRASVTHKGKRWPYFIVQEGGDRMTDISVFCHEFGHMLGLPDLYARPEVPGMEGVGVWCAMSQQLPNGRPQHFSAWCKEQLGWVKPTLIDPRVKQKIVLSPVEDDPTQYLKVPVRADGSEYLLLENRRKKGFDTELPAEGLLIWRVVRGGGGPQPVYLEEAHGVSGPSGPRQYPAAVPFPSPANTSFTPDTVPSSRSQLGGGLDVHISNIRRLPDGRVAFRIGYEYQ